MTVSDRNVLEETLGRAAQYDLVLCRRRAEPGEEVFGWRLSGRELGPGFLSRPLAFDWIARWLDEDTASQGMHLRS